jgi:HIRAN domain
VGVTTRASSILIPLPGLRQMDPRAIPALRMIDALLARPHCTPEQVRHRQRRADALALLTESSVWSYPSWIAALRRKSPAGIDRRRYAYEHIRPGEALELVREPANQNNDHAVAYHHRGVHLGYVPRRHRWIAKALDDGLRLAAIVETVKIGRIFRHRAKFVGTRIVVLYDGR